MIEMVSGLALIGLPGFVGRALLGADLSASGIAVARVAGLGLLSLGLACWPGQHDIPPHVTRALFVYNLFAALYLGYLRMAGGFVSYLLWPASILHAVLTILFIVQNRRGSRSAYLA